MASLKQFWFRTARSVSRTVQVGLEVAFGSACACPKAIGARVLTICVLTISALATWVFPASSVCCASPLTDINPKDTTPKETPSETTPAQVVAQSPKRIEPEAASPDRPSAGPFSVRWNVMELSTARVMERELQTKTTLLWEQRPLREALLQLAETQKFDLWLDRRVDPNQKLSVKTDGQVTLREILAQIAKQIGCEMGLVENVVYIGPTDSVAKAQASAARLHDQWMSHRTATTSKNNKDTTSDQGYLQQVRPLVVEELSTPTQVLQDVARNWNVRLNDRLPHDLWHSHQLNATGFATQVTLIAIGFDQEGTLDKTGSVLQLRTHSNATAWSATYRDPAILKLGVNRAALIKLVRSLNGKVRIRNGAIQVTGTGQLHSALLQRAERENALGRGGAGGKSGATVGSDALYTLEVRNKSIEAVLAGLANSVGVEVEWAASLSKNDREKIVSFQVENANIDDMLAALAKASGLAIVREGSTVRVQE